MYRRWKTAAVQAFRVMIRPVCIRTSVLESLSDDARAVNEPDHRQRLHVRHRLRRVAGSEGLCWPSRTSPSGEAMMPYRARAPHASRKSRRCRPSPRTRAIAPPSETRACTHAPGSAAGQGGLSAATPASIAAIPTGHEGGRAVGLSIGTSIGFVSDGGGGRAGQVRGHRTA